MTTSRFVPWGADSYRDALRREHDQLTAAIRERYAEQVALATDPAVRLALQQQCDEEVRTATRLYESKARDLGYSLF